MGEVSQWVFRHDQADLVPERGHDWGQVPSDVRKEQKERVERPEWEEEASAGQRDAEAE